MSGGSFLLGLGAARRPDNRTDTALEAGTKMFPEFKRS
jgi:hypothetical protein